MFCASGLKVVCSSLSPYFAKINLKKSARANPGFCLHSAQMGSEGEEVESYQYGHVGKEVHKETKTQCYSPFLTSSFSSPLLRSTQ